MVRVPCTFPPDTDVAALAERLTEAWRLRRAGREGYRGLRVATADEPTPDPRAAEELDTDLDAGEADAAPLRRRRHL